jgi:predicted N-acetyltransferase YhbS
MKFRNLHLNDLNVIARLFKNNLFYLQQDKSIDQSSPETVVKQLFFHCIISTPLNLFGLDTFVSYVAQTNDGEIVGTITARRYPLAKSWIIGPLVCHKDFRNQGIGTKLMNLILEHLKTKKATCVIVSTGRNNKKGLMFFERFGFEYLNHVSLDHKGARNYVRKIAITYGYLPKLSRKIQLTHSLRSRHKLRPTKETKMWYILLKTI